MPKEDHPDPRKSFAVRNLPWLLGAIMLAIYLATINPWLTLLNLGQVATVAGWNWHPQLTDPLLFLVTRPFHWLPTGHLPLLLNVFSAFCASLVLVILARCVAILPHDRLEVERQRERSDFSFLTGPFSVIPPTIAVVLVGLQLTFWEHATNFTGESFDLLLFAGILWQLLEYRLDEVPGRLYLAALAYGAGMAEDWVFIAYFPVFLTAILWLRKLDFFIPQFLVRMALSGCAGLLLLFLLPCHLLISGQFGLGFWAALHPVLGADWGFIRSLDDGAIWRQLVLVSLASLLPLLVLSIRWSSNFGDSNRLSAGLVNYLIYAGHTGFFALCTWVMFDPPFSPKQLGQSAVPGLTLYYLAALSLGYFCGFFLIVFGKKHQASRRSPHRPEPILPESVMWLCPLIVGGVVAISVAAVLLLTYKNAPLIRTANRDILLKYAQFMTRSLPPGGAILLSDADVLSQQPATGYLVRAMLAREGKTQMYPVVDTAALKYSFYQNILHERYPTVWPLLFKQKQPLVVSAPGLLQIMNQLSRSNTICYLNPSFGYYFETFYLEPHGLIYTLKPLPAETLLPPPVDAGMIRENEQFWSDVIDSEAPGIEAALLPVDPNRPQNFADSLLTRLHVTPEPDADAIYAGTLYSRGLDYWGVQLQRAGELDRAAASFQTARRFDPDNFSAGVNLEFNRELHAGKIPPLDLTKATPDHFGKFHSWTELLGVNGPIDEPSFNDEEALVLANRNGSLRQSIALYNRVQQLMPDDFGVRRRLAEAYLLNHLPDRALEVLQDPFTEPARFGLNNADQADLSEQVATVFFQKRDYARGIALLEQTVAQQPTNQMVLTVTLQACLRTGFYTNALTLIDRKLQQSPDDPQWVFARGFTDLQAGHFQPAITEFTRTMELSTNNPAARLNRAIAHLDLGQLNEAQADYARLQASYTNSPPVAFGLGEIAWRQHDTNEAIRNYKIYLANANTNTAEATNIVARLRALQR